VLLDNAVLSLYWSHSSVGGGNQVKAHPVCFNDIYVLTQRYIVDQVISIYLSNTTTLFLYSVCAIDVSLAGMLFFFCVD
jgi:hypothetical protein